MLSHWKISDWTWILCTQSSDFEWWITVALATHKLFIQTDFEPFRFTLFAISNGILRDVCDISSIWVCELSCGSIDSVVVWLYCTMFYNNRLCIWLTIIPFILIRKWSSFWKIAATSSVNFITKHVRNISKNVVNTPSKSDMHHQSSVSVILLSIYTWLWKYQCRIFSYSIGVIQYSFFTVQNNLLYLV